MPKIVPSPTTEAVNVFSFIAVFQDEAATHFPPPNRTARIGPGGVSAPAAGTRTVSRPLSSRYAPPSRLTVTRGGKGLLPPLTTRNVLAASGANVEQTQMYVLAPICSSWNGTCRPSSSTTKLSAGPGGAIFRRITWSAHCRLVGFRRTHSSDFAARHSSPTATPTTSRHLMVVSSPAPWTSPWYRNRTSRASAGIPTERRRWASRGGPGRRAEAGGEAPPGASLAAAARLS